MAASIRSTARSGRPGTPEVRNRPCAAPARSASMNVLATSSGESETRRMRPALNIGQ